MLSAYKLSNSNFPSAFVTAVLLSSSDSSVASFVILYVAPGTRFVLFAWYFCISSPYFYAILIPILFGSVCVLYFPSGVFNAKYTP